MKRKVTSKEYQDIKHERAQETCQLDPLVKIKLGGREYILEFDNRALINIYKGTNINIMQVGLSMDIMAEPANFGITIFEGLRKHHSELTLDAVNSMFSFRHYPYILDRVQLALRLFMPNMEDVEELPDAVDSTGSSADPTEPQTQAG